MCEPNEACLKCGDFAGFEKSPEGSCCGICGEWVCDSCIDYSVSLKEYVLPNGKIIIEDVICKECSKELNLHNLTPVKEL